ncbi:hypothetical protein PYCC9005_000318 [Savitreella phatthalungensis]
MAEPGLRVDLDESSGFSQASEDASPNVEESVAQERIARLHALAREQLSHLLTHNGSRPSSISQIAVLGSPNTRHSFLLKLFRPVLDTQDGTLDGVTKTLINAVQRLRDLDIFDRLHVELDKCDNAPDGCLAAIIRVREKSRLLARTGTDFGNQEGSAYASASLRNVFGGAETLDLSGSVGTRTRTSYEGRFTTPINAKPNSIFELSAYAATRQQLHASHELGQRGISAKIKHLSILGVHEIGLHAVSRRMENIFPAAGPAVLLESPASIKHAITCSILRDRRNDAILPTQGYSLAVSGELASSLLGADHDYAKVELAGSMHGSLGRWAVSAAARSGLLQHTNDNTQPAMHDRFFLGGPQSVRGFQMNGLGPSSGRDHIGGDIFWAAGLSATRHIHSQWPIFVQWYLNAGALALSNKPGLPLGQRLARPSIGSGLGLVFKHPAARIELSFGMPLVARQSDAVRKGLQFGIGLEFL